MAAERCEYVALSTWSKSAAVSFSQAKGGDMDQINKEAFSLHNPGFSLNCLLATLLYFITPTLSTSPERSTRTSPYYAHLPWKI